MKLLVCPALAALALSSAPAAARVLEVGAGRAYAMPSDAAAVARDGDTVAIAAGSYFDCASWHASRLTIAGPAHGDDGPLAVITDRACAGKAAFVIAGDGVTVRGISFERIRVPDGNGAGIRAEGRDLTVQDCRFVNDQVGILAGGEGGALRIIATSFVANGASFVANGASFVATGASLDARPTHAVLAGALDLLRIERSSFRHARGGDHVVSAARRTELVGNAFADEGGHMTGALVWVEGGALTLDGNTIELAAATRATPAADRPGAVLFTGDATALTVRGNTLIEPAGIEPTGIEPAGIEPAGIEPAGIEPAGDVPLLRNWSGLAATAADNTVPPNAVAVSASGATYHRLRARLAGLREQARAMALSVRHQLAELARGWRLLP